MGGGAFNGISFDDILLFSVTDFLIDKLFTALKRRAAQVQSPGYGMNREVPNLTRDSCSPPPIFRMTGFGSE